ncbi:hypothetical protein [Nocardia wallacei]|uniref:hypothetical protein n=1 Tax=Nocardia wallacei TaxID=480035 RepID=UPI0024588789|nr:hypothetical protein [Nocardia wallacei]
MGEQTIDRTTRFLGANTSDTSQHLLTVVACYCWVAATVTAECPPRGLRIWRTATLLTLAALITTYLLSDGLHTPAEEFALQDPASRAHHWLVPLYMLATFAMLLRATLAQRHNHGIDYKVSLAAMVLVAVIGLTVSVATAFLLAARPLWLADHYHDLARIGIVPALLALGAAGIPGVIQEWQTRDDPR